MPGFIYFHLERKERRPLLEGRNLQGCALALLRTVEPNVSELLHDKGSHLWSVSAPRPRTDELRVGLARDEELEALTQALLRSNASMEARLGEEPVRVSRVSMGRGRERVPWAGLGGRLLEAQTLRLRLLTPTFFRDGDRDLPDVVRLAASPERVLGSLMARSKRVAQPLPGHAHETPWAFVSEHKLTLQTHAMKVHFHGRRKSFKGVVGELEWRLRDTPPATARWIAALLEWGQFVGVGSRTSMGLGALDVEAS